MVLLNLGTKRINVSCESYNNYAPVHIPDNKRCLKYISLLKKFAHKKQKNKEITNNFTGLVMNAGWYEYFYKQLSQDIPTLN